MSALQIKNRFTNAVIFECELPAEVATQSVARQLGYAVKQARVAGANLTGADLTGADLTGADLTGANLADADLTGANLAGANLADADLTGADLTGADLAGADLTGADLTGADLAGADLAGANLADADLAGANLADAYLTGANLARAKNVPETSVTGEKPAELSDRAERQRQRALRFRERNPDVPVVEALDAKLLLVLESGQGRLKMDSWHTCETTHCRAGWAVTLAGDAGKALEALHGPQRAGSMIYRVSTGRVPHFFASNERAMEDIREQAALMGGAP